MAALEVDLYAELGGWDALVAPHLPPVYAAADGPLEQIAALDALLELFARCRSDIADERARIIAGVAASTSTRQAAIDLGLSPSAVAKAVARARADASQVPATG